MASQSGDETREDSFYLSNTRPTTDPAELKVWWGMGVTKFYSPFKVEFLRREVVPTLPTPKDLLTFKLAGAPDNYHPLEIDLKDDTTQVWPSPPSTIPTTSEIEAAHRAGQRIFGFLFLSNIWIEAEHQRPNGNYRDGPEPHNLYLLSAGGGKWPIAGFGQALPFAEMMREIKSLIDYKNTPEPAQLFNSIKGIISRYL
ncbi:hypothetical protein HUW63_07630 [Myxococcus sp. AM001]|nr:hypothetical protein [Myxococcus sp. AM001]